MVKNCQRAIPPGADLLRGVLVAVALESSCLLQPAIAQIVPDSTLGNDRSQVIPDRPVRGAIGDVIEGGARQGSNLFHSFSEFNVQEGQRVYFANPSGVEHILSRVTGIQSSSILGTLGVDGNANLYLLNPNGILFGPNARLDLRGSFFAGTGDRITFLDGATFRATEPAARPLLTMAAPVGLQYGTRPAGAIDQEGQLAVGPGQRLSLLGGTVTSTGQLTAAGGRVEVLGDRVALLGNARIDVSGVTGGGTILIGGDFQGRGPVPTSDRTFIGSGVSMNADALDTGNGGRVSVWADQITGFYGNISARGGANSGDGGFVEVSGGRSLEFQGNVNLGATHGRLGTLLLDPENIRIANVPPPAANDAQLPEILFATDPGASYVISSTALQSQTAAVILEATNNITVDNGVSLNFLAAGNSIRFTADADQNGAGSFVMDSTQTISTNGRNLTISGASLLLGNLNTSSNTGNGGRITLSANNGNLTVAELNSNATVQPGLGGDISLFATNNITSGFIDTAGVINSANGNLNGANVSIRSVDGQISLTGQDSSLDSIEARSVEINAPGALTIAGNLNIRTDSLARAGDITIGNIAAPSSITVAVVSTRNLGGGEGGDVRIRTTGVFTSTTSSLTGSNFSIATESSRGRGAIEIFATGGIFASGGIVSNSLTSGSGGAILLRSDNGEIRLGAGTVDSRAGTTGTLPANGSGGRIDIEAANTVSINGTVLSGSNILGNSGDIRIVSQQSSVETTAIDSRGRTDGGDINVSGDDTITINGAVFSGTNVSGNAGDIQILSQRGSINTTNHLINASASLIIPGNAGNVTLRADNGNISAGFIESVGLLGGSIRLLSGQDMRLATSDVASITTGAGRGGDIVLRGRSLHLTDSRIVSFTLGAGRAGDVRVRVSDQINILNTDNNSPAILAGQSLLFSNLRAIPEFQGSGLITSTAGAGDSGNVRMRTDRLIIRNTAQLNPDELTGIATITALGSAGNAGNLDIQANQAIEIIGNRPGAFVPLSGINTAIQVNNISTGLTSATQGTGQAGSLTIVTPQLTLQDGAAATSGNSSSSPGTGAGNTLSVTADRLELRGLAALATATFGSAAAGDLRVTANRIVLDDGALFAADTLGAGAAGNIRLDATDLNLLDGSRIGAATAGTGQGGTIIVDARNAVNIDGTSGDRTVRSGIFTTAQTELPGQLPGRGGNIVLNTPLLTLSDRGEISVTGFGAGIPGDIEVNANHIFLSQQARIAGQTQTVPGVPETALEGGNLRLIATEDIRLSNDGGTVPTEITTSAAAASRGGRIFLRAGRAILGVLAENSDIVADADRGQGGLIDAEAPLIAQFRQYNGQRTRQSDFTAASVTGGDGTVDANADNPQPPLPTQPDLPRILPVCPTSQGAASREAGRSEFFDTGRGGLPPDPAEALNNNTPTVPWVTLEPDSPRSSAPLPTARPGLSSDGLPESIAEVYGWQRLPNGEVLLTAMAAPARPICQPGGREE